MPRQLSFTQQYQRLLVELELAAARSELREEPIPRHDLNDLLVVFGS